MEKEILNSKELDGTISRLAFQVIEICDDFNDIKLIGIKRRGAFIADRLKEKIKNYKNIDIEVGYLDITLYRDDLTEIAECPIVHDTEINFDITNKILVLIDDVIFTGRTVRAALDALSDIGRAKKIMLLTLVDRGHRELPIQPNFVGKDIPTSLKEKINVKINEVDGVDSVTIEKL